MCTLRGQQNRNEFVLALKISSCEVQVLFGLHIHVLGLLIDFVGYRIHLVSLYLYKLAALNLLLTGFQGDKRHLTGPSCINGEFSLHCFLF